MSAIIDSLKIKNNKREEKVLYPKTVLGAVIDPDTKESLDVILDDIKHNSELASGSAYIDFDEQSSEVPGEVESVTSAKLVSYSNISSNLEATDVQSAIDETSSIAKGKNRARVFSTTEDMNAWLSDATNKGIALVGDNLYVVALDVPDWWISEVLEEVDTETGFYYKIAQLETQKVDLTNIESSISNLETNLMTGIDTTGKDFNNLGNKSFIGTGSGMTNDPISNPSARYLVQHICAGSRITQYAKLINWSNGELNYFRQLNEDNTWSVWSRIVIGYDITTLNNSITAINNTLTQNLIFPNQQLTDIDNPPHGVSMNIIDQNLYVALTYSWISLEFRISSTAQPKLRRKYGSSGWTEWQNITLS